MFEHVLEYLGRFHLLVLHFPIALVITAALVEALDWWTTRKQPLPPPCTVTVILLWATLFVLLTAITGWLHALDGAGSSQPTVLSWHRWSGTATALLVVGTALLSIEDSNDSVRSPITRVLIFVSALAVGVTGHLGGTLTHGPGFLSW